MRFDGFSFGSVWNDAVSYDHASSGDLDVTHVTRPTLRYQSRMHRASALERSTVALGCFEYRDFNLMRQVSG